MKHQNLEESLGEFEQFDEQYLTYSCSSQMQQFESSTRKLTTAPNSQKPRLKIIQHVNEHKTNSIFNNKKAPKNVSSNSRVISIGSAVFRSNFQSGNLYSVDKIAPTTYKIQLTKEMNSQRTSAWFYFACEGLKGQVKFIIRGFTKTSSLYNCGMKVCCREISEASKWRRAGTKICYSQSYLEDQDYPTTYELQFSYFFKSSPNGVQFAYCFPYTYTNLINFINLNKIKCSSLGQTYEGREIPLLHIGNQKSNKVVIISARAHPGETVGSLMMQGFLKQLISESKQSKKLREAFLFKIVPMINIDGVVNGNYRFSASGFDLNRKWKKCSEKYHPEIFFLKQMIIDTNKQKQVIMYVDLHGHSRQKNVFFYGCCPKGLTDIDGKLNTRPKEFPFLMSKLHSPFRYDYCSYAVQKQKEGTARISMWNELKIDYVYTLEASFCGSEGGANYLISDYHKIGQKLCHGICLHFWPLIKQLIPSDQNSSQELFANKIQEQMKKNMDQFFENPALAAIEFDGNSSDSEPEAGQVSIKQRTNENGKKNNGKKNNIISIQKYYKASKLMKLSERQGGLQQNGNYFKNKSQQVPNSHQGLRNKTNESLNGNKLLQLPKRQEILSKNSNRSFAKSHNQHYVKTEQLNRTLHQKLFSQEKTEQINDSKEIESQMLNDNRKKDTEGNDQKQQSYLKKKKVTCFQGAQYRRVRKMAEQHNRRHYSAQTSSLTNKDEDPLIKGLIGMNNLIEIDRLRPRKKVPSFFPNSTSTYKGRKNSMQMHFRKQIRANEYTTRRLHVNGADQEVKCMGKQIF